MSDEEIVRAYIDGSYYETPGGPLYHYETDGGIDAIGARTPALAALSRILSDRDSLRTDLERAYEQIRRDHEDYSKLYDSLERVKAERDSLRTEMKQRAAASAERVQMDGETIASLRAALEQIATLGEEDMGDIAVALEAIAIARQALTSSEKDRGPMVMQQLQQTTSSDATLRGTSSEKERCPACGNPDRSFIECMDPFHPVTSSEKEKA